MTNFFDLTYTQVRDMAPATAEKVLHSILADRASVTGGGKILRWSEYNENPDLLINRLLAKLLIDKMNPDWFDNLSYKNIVVISIESSAAYLAVELAFEVMRAFCLDRPLRIIRARKTETERSLSPAMSDDRCTVEVEPITANGGVRHLTASFPHETDFSAVKLAIVLDDFKATGSTLGGGIKLAQTLIKPERIIPMAAMGKSWQANVDVDFGEGVEQPLVGLDARFWWDKKEGKALISVNDLAPLPLVRVKKKDFMSDKGRK